MTKSPKRTAARSRGRTLSAFHKARLFRGMREGWRRRFEARRVEFRRAGRFPKAGQRDPWLPEEDKLLSKLPTAELVRVLGRTFSSIRARRLFLDVRACPPVWQQPWRAWEIRLLGTAPDRV